MMVLMLVVVRSTDCYICLGRTSLPLVLSQDGNMVDSITPRVTETLIKFLKPQLTPKARTHQVTKVEIKFNWKRLKNRTAEFMVLMAQSRNFGNCVKLILAFIPKHDFILMTCSSVMQIHKNS
jgi:hypothetical protein